MTMRLALILAGTAFMSASAFAEGPAAKPKDEANAEAPAPEMKALIESCAARKFETIVKVEGKAGGSKVKLCGKEGQSDADWVKTLQDAAKKVEANSTMAPEVKGQIITALTLEISKVQGAEPIAKAPTEAPAVATVLPPEDRFDYSILPPIAEPSKPEGKPTIATTLPPASRSDYSILPPIPEPPKMAATSLAATPAAAPKKPRLTVRCLARGESGDGSPCDSLERGTRLAIRADEDLAGDASLRFLRRGDFRGEVALAQMRQGQSIRAKLPSQLCSGVISSKVEIQVIGGSNNQVLETLGPYWLTC